MKLLVIVVASALSAALVVPTVSQAQGDKFLAQLSVAAGQSGAAAQRA